MHKLYIYRDFIVHFILNQNILCFKILVALDEFFFFFSFLFHCVLFLVDFVINFFPFIAGSRKGIEYRNMGTQL